MHFNRTIDRMKIAMFTNTYLPHVGGVARAVDTLANACRARGHEVRIVAPQFDEQEAPDDVLRVPAIRNFNGSDFAVRLPIPNLVREFMDSFQPDLIHSHHPFLMGDTALRESWKLEVPIIFTHHTLYERYTHYVSADSPAMKRMVVSLATEYANLCEHIIAPSESVQSLLVERGVKSTISAIPTGIDLDLFAAGDGNRFRERFGIPLDAIVIGHVGRLAKEKNLIYLTQSVCRVLKENPKTIFLVVGDGDAREEMKQLASQEIDQSRYVDVGKQLGTDLADAYQSMDLFVFASQSETQGLVLAEAMAAGNPVVALDGPGVREIMNDGHNGFMLDSMASEETFSRKLSQLVDDQPLRKQFASQALADSKLYGVETCSDRMIDCYQQVVDQHAHLRTTDLNSWDRLVAGLEIEWNLLVEKFTAVSCMVSDPDPKEEVSVD